MKFPFAITVAIEAEIENIVPDGEENMEVTLSANGCEAKCCFDAVQRGITVQATSSQRGSPVGH